MKTLKNINLIITALIISILSPAQNNFNYSKLDSIKDDSLKYEEILKTAGKIKHPAPEFIPYMLQAVEYAEKNKMPFKYALTLKKAAFIYFFNGDLKESILFFKKAAFIFNRLNKTDDMLGCYNMIANHYSYLEEYDKAIITNKQILDIAKKNNKLERQISAYRQIGTNYTKLEQPDSAAKYINKAIKLGLQSNSLKNNAYNYSDLGDYYFKKNNFKKAVFYQYKALKFIKNTPDFIHPKTLIYQRLASAYAKTGKLDSAKIFINKALKNKQIIKQYALSADIAAEIALKQNKLDSSEKYLDTAKNYLLKIKDFNKLDKVYKQYINLYLYKKNFDYIKFYNKLRIRNFDSVRKYCLKKQNENIYLSDKMNNFEKQITRLSSEQKQNKLKIKKYYGTLIGTLIIIAIIILFAILQNNFMKKIKKKNKLILQQKEELKKQAEELSIYKNHLEELISNRTFHLIKAKRKAEESDRLKSAFLANMSHEIRTPMNAILGFSELLSKKDYDKEKRNKIISHIMQSSSALLRLIDDIIDISKIEAGQLNINKSKFPVKEIVKELEFIYHEKITNPGNVKLKLFTNSDLSVIINTDKHRILQVLINLIDNALKFTEKGYVEANYYINEEQTKKEIIFYVKDTGIGINKNDINKIFDRFIKLEDTSGKLYRGTGLGLSISKHIIELLGGKIKVTSEQGKGSVFKFSIPA